MSKVQTLNPQPIQPAPAYENAHQIARDLLQHIELQLDRMIRQTTRHCDGHTCER